MLKYFSLIVLLFLQACSNEDWNRFDERVNGVSFDIVSKKNPYDDVKDKKDDDNNK